MSNAKRDQNNTPTLLGISSADGVTPVPISVNPTTHRVFNNYSIIKWLGKTTI